MSCQCCNYRQNHRLSVSNSFIQINKGDPKQHPVYLELKSEQATIIVLQYSHVLKDTSENWARVMNNFWVLKIFVS